MKLLIITQKIDINDDVLGFMHGWVKEFAKQCEQVIVICLYKGEYDLPSNVKVLSLGKERITNPQIYHKFTNRFKYFINFYKYIWQERKNYDKVFVHMNPEYVVLGGIFWRILGKKIGLWYAHGSVSKSLRLAEMFSDIVFTSTESGFRLKSKKKKVVGQGIDVKRFEFKRDFFYQGKLKIIYIGRISPVKNLETLIEAAEILKRKNFDFEVKIVGGVGLKEQESYLEKLKISVKEKGLSDRVEFVGSIPNKDIHKHYQEADIFVNTSQTGSLDKTMLEALASGLPVITCNESALEIFGDKKSELFFLERNPEELVEKINNFVVKNSWEKIKTADELKNNVKNNYGIKKLIYKIKNLYEHS